MKEFDLQSLVKSRFGENYELHEKYMNKTFVKVLRTIGFDKCFLKGDGCYLYDGQGNDYLDFISGYGVFGLGRNHPVVGKAIKDAIDMKVSNMVQLNCALLSGLLAEELVKRLGGRLEAVFFCNSGTEANEGAVKFARAFTKRPRVLSQKGGYHGLTYGSLSLTVSKNFQDGFGGMLPGFGCVPYDDLDALEAELKKGDVAAFIVECVQGHGVHIPREDYLPKAQELCRKYGTLFICDEVQTGLGRTGKMFAFNHWNLDPDIVTVAKTLSGGYVPVGAFITTRAIHQAAFSNLERCVVHSTTFGRNALAMVAGLATLSVLDNENMVERSAEAGKKIVERINALREKHDYIKEARGMGLMIAIEFQEPKSILKKAAWKALKMANDALFTQMIVTYLMDNHRIITQVTDHGSDVLKILPPYISGDKEIDRFINALDDVLTNAGNITGPLWKFGKRLMESSKEAKKQQ